MAFPSSPTNGQTATVGGITYIYNSTKTAWVRNPSVGTNISVFTAAITSTISSTSPISGALLVYGGAGVAGNIHVGQNIYVSNLKVSTESYAAAMSVAMG